MTSMPGSKWVHVLTGIDPEARTATCRGCGVVRIVYRKGRGWKCSQAASGLVAKAAAKRVEARRHRPSPQETPAPASPEKPGVSIAPVAPPEPSVEVIAGPIRTGSAVRMSAELMLPYRDEDGHMKRFWGVVGEVVGRSRLYPTCWLVRWPDDGDRQHIYSPRFLELVRVQ